MNSAAKEIRRNYSKKVCKKTRQLRNAYSRQVSDKLISLIRATLRLLAKHFNSVVGEAPLQETKMDFEDQQECGDIVFVLNTYLNLPDVEVKPSIDEVQNMLNTAGKIIISVTRGVGQWRQIKKKTGKVVHQICGSVGKDIFVQVPGFVPNCESSKEKALYNPMKV